MTDAWTDGRTERLIRPSHRSNKTTPDSYPHSSTLCSKLPLLNYSDRSSPTAALGVRSFFPSAFPVVVPYICTSLTATSVAYGSTTCCHDNGTAAVAVAVHRRGDGDRVIMRHATCDTNQQQQNIGVLHWITRHSANEWIRSEKMLEQFVVRANTVQRIE